MWWFKKQNKNQAEEKTADMYPAQDNESENTIPKDKFILEDSPINNTGELPIYVIYKRFQDDWETKGYNDAINFPETTYSDFQKMVIVDQLRLAIKEAIIRYEDKIVDLDIHIAQAKKNGLLETYDKYLQEKKKLDAHREELSTLDKDAEDIGKKTTAILTSYDMGFTRGIVYLSNEKVSEIMNK